MIRVKSKYFEVSGTILKKCSLRDPKAQEELYKGLYGYAMSIALRYSANRDDAVEILNDSFLKVFDHIGHFEKDKNFKSWLRKIIINTSIDKFRASKSYTNEVIEYMHENPQTATGEIITGNLNAEDIIKMIQHLPDIYRVTFNLYEVEGYSHEEISEKLGISISTSRSNLSRAKEKLRAIINKNLSYEQA